MGPGVLSVVTKAGPKDFSEDKRDYNSRTEEG